MSDTSEADHLALEKIRLARSKMRYDLAKILITVVIATCGVAVMNHMYQNRQLEQQRLLHEAELQLQQKKTEMELQLQEKKTETELQLQEKHADAERRQAEMKYLGDFLTHALEEEHDKRLRFAEYFATLTISSDLQDRWKAYYTKIETVSVELQQREEELRIAIATNQHEKVRELTTEVARLRSQLDALPQKQWILQQHISQATFTDTQEVHYTLTVSNISDSMGNTVLTDVMTTGTNGGSLTLEHMNIDCPETASCDVTGLTDTMLRVSFSDVPAHQSAVIRYTKYAHADGIPSGELSYFTHMAMLSTGGCSQSTVGISAE